MKDPEQLRKELEEQLELVKRRLQILDMIDERLYEMKRLAKKVIDEDLSRWEARKINKKVRKLEKEVKLLDRESTELS